MPKLDETAQAVPFDPRFGDVAITHAINTDEVGGQCPERCRMESHRSPLGAAKSGVNRHHVPFGDEEVDGLAGVGKRAGLASQEVAQLIAASNRRLAGRAAVPHKVRRDQFIEPLPVLPVEGVRVHKR